MFCDSSTNWLRHGPMNVNHMVTDLDSYMKESPNNGSLSMLNKSA